MVDAARALDLITRDAQEVVTTEEVEALASRIAAGEKVKGYIGFEPSGSVHLGWAVVANKIRDLVDAGVEMTVLLADWHAMINDKLGGDLEKIRACGEYMIHCFTALGVPTDRVRFRWAGDVVDDGEYWATFVRVAKASSLARVKRAMDIMGRTADEGEKDFSKFLYPGMQVADIFHMQMDLAYGGLDQRHAHMLARDVAKKLDMKAPVALHTPLLPALDAAGRMDPLEAKMSKSRPDSGILIHDTPEDIQRKVKKAHCPQGEVEGNPVLDVVRLVVFPSLRRLAETDGGPGATPRPFVVARPEKFGGSLSFDSFEALRDAFQTGALHPADLKNGVTAAMTEILAPVALHFEAHPEPLARMRGMTVTR
jgi:tyrosyl-tRNA synthetase